MDDFQKKIEEMEDIAENNQIGNLIAKGIGVGLSEDSYIAVTALENVYVELETVTSNAWKNIQNYEKKKRDRELKNLKNALDLQLITEQEYYEKLKDYRDNNLRQGTDLWYKVTEEIVKYNKRVWQEALKEQETAAEEAAKHMAEMVEAQNRLEKKIEDNLKENTHPLVESSKVRFLNVNDDGSDQVFHSEELTDFEEDNEILERFSVLLTALKSFDYMPDELFAEIASMDVEEALNVMEKIISASEESRRQFAEGYRTKNVLAKNIAADLAEILYKDIFATFQEVSAENQEEGLESAVAESEKNVFAEQLEQYFETIPEAYYELGETSGEAFGTGLEDGMMYVMKDDATVMIVDVANGVVEEVVLNTEPPPWSYSDSSANTYNYNYNFNTSKDTTTEQIFAAQSASALEKLRGVN